MKSVLSLAAAVAMGVAIALAGPTAVAAEIAPTDGVVHVLIIADTDSDYDTDGDGIPNWGFDVSRERMIQLLRSLPDDERQRMSLTVLSGPKATPRNIELYFRKLGSSPIDVIFVYYYGHGEVTKNFTSDEREYMGVPPERQSPKYHMLTMKHGNLRRTDLQNLMLSCPARFCLCFADCCASFSTGSSGRIDGNPRTIYDAARKMTTRMRGAQRQAINSPLQANPQSWRVLMRQHMGFLDIGGAPVGYFGHADQTLGGYSSYLFTEAMCASNDYITPRVAPYRQLNWDGMLSYVLQEEYKCVFPQQRSLRGRIADEYDLYLYGFQSLGPTQFGLTGDCSRTDRIATIANGTTVFGYSGRVKCRINPDKGELNGFYDVTFASNDMVTKYNASRVFEAAYSRDIDHVVISPIQKPSKSPWRTGVQVRLR